MIPRWAELVVLMGFGDGTEDRLQGRVRVREVNPLPDDVGEDEAYGRVELHATLGRVAVHEDEFAVAWSGDRRRVASVDGRVRAIFGDTTTWLFEGDTDVPVAYDARTSSLGWSGSDFVRRLPPSRWEGTDFTRLTGPITASEHLGRRAWAFQLAPTRHKPYPLQLVVDAETGIVLRQSNHDFGSYAEWVELDMHLDLPDELFTWTGASVPASQRWRERDEEHERDLAERRAWLHAHGVVLELPVEPEVLLHEWSDDDGTFQASFDTHASGSLLRRPRSDAPWPDTGRVHFEQSYRWSDSRWDWLLASTRPIAAEQLALLKVRLAAST